MKAKVHLNNFFAIIFFIQFANSYEIYKEFFHRNTEDKLSPLQAKNLLQLGKLDRRDVDLDSEKCKNEIRALQQGISKKDMCAIKMLDASSKIPSGLLVGNIIDMGMYDECISVRCEILGTQVRGRHCMYSIKIGSQDSKVPISPQLSICLPATCSTSEIATFLNSSVEIIRRLKAFDVGIESVTCAPLDPIIWDKQLIIFTSIFSGFLLFLVACTVSEIVIRRLPPGQYGHYIFRSLENFSMRKNAISIINTKVKEDNLPAIHGIRFLSMAWIVMGHEYVTQVMGVNVNNLDIVDWLPSWKSLHVFTAPFAVDTFFAISGFLMAYLFLKNITKQRKFNVGMYYVHRYIRLTPLVMILLAFSLVVVPKIGDGARWNNMMSFFVEPCKTKWWPFLIYGQNFVDKDNFCLGHLWYLSVDMQLFLISPIILYPLWKKPKIGLGIVSLLCLASVIITAYVVGINKYPLVSFTHGGDINQLMAMFKDVYIMPYTRASPWLIGILFGYLVFNEKRRLNKKIAIIGWTFSTFCFAFCIFGTKYFMARDYVYEPIQETIFATISRMLWAIGVCWIAYACISGVGGPVASLLSFKIFIPLSRISYSVYLVHLLIQIIKVGLQRTPNFFSDFRIFNFYLADLALSVFVAFLFTLLFESPLVNLEKIILRRKPTDPTYKNHVEANGNNEEENFAGSERVQETSSNVA